MTEQEDTTLDFLNSLALKPYDQDRAYELSQKFLDLLEEAVETENVYLTTPFSKLSFLCTRNHWTRAINLILHSYRRSISAISEMPQELERECGLFTCRFLHAHTAGALPFDGMEEKRSELYVLLNKKVERDSYLDYALVQLFQLDKETGLWVARDEENAADVVMVDLSNTEYNESYAHTIDFIGTSFPLPLNVALHQIDILEEVYTPKMVVIEPDYLFNVTSIAGCFSPNRTDTIPEIAKKFIVTSSNKNLLVGNIANHFLDRLLHAPKSTFNDLFKQTFELFPLEMCLLDDGELRDVMQIASLHFSNLSEVIREQFPKIQLRKEMTQLEPSFYSEKYGIQGRLDLLSQKNKGNEEPIIVELKSGSPFMSNSYGISHSHFIQTSLYDLLIRSASDNAQRSANYILYSKLSHNALRYAPNLAVQQAEAMAVRNELLHLEQQLADSKNPGDLLEFFNPENHPGVKGFSKTNLEVVHRALKSLKDYEYEYVRIQVSFIASELRMTKIGMDGLRKRKGHSSLWRDTIRDKAQRFEVLSNMEIERDELTGEDHYIYLRHTEITNELSSFRQGDIAVLYPLTHPRRSAVLNQILKGTIIELGPKSAKFRLRYPQLYRAYFSQHKHWNLEPDSLDSSFNRQYQGLLQFSQAPEGRRDLLMGVKAPRFNSKAIAYDWPPRLTNTQKSVLSSMTTTQDYALIWGPPGTGKTSVILRNYVEYLISETDENVLLLAYTNRAVDEISAALRTIENLDFIRIGSRFSTRVEFRDHLLSERSKKSSSRKELRGLIDHTRVFVATVHSISGKNEIFELKKFQTAIIDEASQILEPMLLGLLTKFQRFYLIGDHKQLPAVVTLPKSQTKIESVSLNELHIKSTADSLFERLLRVSESAAYHAVFSLDEQGRMHREIMDLPNRLFYEGKLRIIPNITRLEAPLSLIESPAPRWLSRRVSFMHVQPYPDDLETKKNRAEAEKLIELLRDMKQYLDYNPADIGVICPFRAQIALIIQMLSKENLYDPEMTIDTVERYQGGSKGIIIISATATNSRQLQQMIALSEEGIDRKLNVALTRAKERLIMIGDRTTLTNVEAYSEYIHEYTVS